MDVQGSINTSCVLSTYLSIYLNTGLGRYKSQFFTKVDKVKKYKFLSNPKGTRAQATQGLKFSSEVSWFELLETKAFTFILPAITAQMKSDYCKMFISQDFLKIKNFKMFSVKILSLTTLINKLTMAWKMHWINHFIFSCSCFYLMIQMPTFDVNGKGLPLLSKVFGIIILFHWDSAFNIDHNWGKYWIPSQYKIRFAN